MKDIIDIGSDLVIEDSQVPRAANILSTQLGSLEYAQDFGVDMKYFLQEGIAFQTASYVSYITRILANAGINVKSIVETVGRLQTDLDIDLKAAEESTALIAR